MTLSLLEIMPFQLNDLAFLYLTASFCTVIDRYYASGFSDSSSIHSQSVQYHSLSWPVWSSSSLCTFSIHSLYSHFLVAPSLLFLAPVLTLPGDSIHHSVLTILDLTCTDSAVPRGASPNVQVKWRAARVSTVEVSDAHVQQFLQSRRVVSLDVLLRPCFTMDQWRCMLRHECLSGMTSLSVMLLKTVHKKFCDALVQLQQLTRLEIRAVENSVLPSGCLKSLPSLIALRSLHVEDYRSDSMCGILRVRDWFLEARSMLAMNFPLPSRAFGGEASHKPVSL
jgi:hypothetical protein